MLRAVLISTMIVWTTVVCANDLPYVPSPIRIVQAVQNGWTP